MLRHLLGWSLLLGWMPCLAFGAGPQVEIITGDAPSDLDQRAAVELAGQLQRLYQAETKITPKSMDVSAHAIFVGNPTVNPAMRAWSDQWPSLSDQGHCLKSVTFRDQPALLVGGGSAAATYWAVAEWGHQLGIRSLLAEDLDPVTPPAFNLAGRDVVLEPALRQRAWSTIDSSAIGAESWGPAEQRQLIGQLAKLKFNQLVIRVSAWQPFVNYEFQQIKKSTAVLAFGQQYPVSGDTAGRAAFGGAKWFGNAAFAGASTLEDRLAAGQRLLTEIIDAAHHYGLTVSLAFAPAEFPKEFSPLLTQAASMPGSHELAIGPSDTQPPDNPSLLALSETQIRAYLSAYPQLDSVELKLPDVPAWTDADRRRLLAQWQHVVTATPRADGRNWQVSWSGLPPTLWSDPPQLPALGGQTFHGVDLTMAQLVKEPTLLASTPAQPLACQLQLLLSDARIGVLPQASHTALATLLDSLRMHEWEGFAARACSVGELDLSCYLVSRNSFGAGLSTEQACSELVTPICGGEVAERVMAALDSIQRATSLIEQHDRDLGQPLPDVVMRHYAATDPPPAWWQEVRTHYLQAMNEMYRANTRTREGARSYTLYLARRAEFGYEYMNCLEAVRLAGVAKAEQNETEQVAQLEAAVDAITNALNAMAAVARSGSDRGVIAVLNEYAYRPLVRELDAQ